MISLESREINLNTYTLHFYEDQLPEKAAENILIVSRQHTE